MEEELQEGAELMFYEDMDEINEEQDVDKKDERFDILEQTNDAMVESIDYFKNYLSTLKIKNVGYMLFSNTKYENNLQFYDLNVDIFINETKKITVDITKEEVAAYLNRGEVL